MARIAITSAAIAGLVYLMLSAQVAADMTDLKSMILMPGPLTRAHAREEKNCEACHSSFDKSAQDSLCLDCHEEVAADRDESRGFHGRSRTASRAECSRCHTDHEGRDHNIMPLDRDTFDHEHTDFALTGKHSDTPCESCHLDNNKFRDTPGQCFDCHQDDDQHRGSLGQQCTDCHTPDRWSRPADFDHSKTDFPLRGSHESLQCGSCHAGEQYSFDSNDCIGCHKPQDVHLGHYGQQCDRCHTEEEWQSPVFDHGAETDFPLTGAHRDSPCHGCHIDGLKNNRPSTECASCHRGSDVHSGRHGDSCENCHDTGDWELVDFDHGRQAKWPLTGKHRDVTCLQCHQGSLDEQVSRNCKSCHLANDVHKSANLGDCSTCHGSEGWAKTHGFDHELTRFPLEGMHAIAPCQSCHSDHEFHRASSACIDCHQPDDVHQYAMGRQCESCHTPNDWSLWTFDHESATDFELAGAHAGLSCGSCHQGDDADDVPRSCAGCHAGDDRHEGSLGNNCDRCHSSDSFGEIQWRK